MFAHMDTPDCNPEFVQIEIDRLHQMLKRNDTVRGCMHSWCSGGGSSGKGTAAAMCAPRNLHAVGQPCNAPCRLHLLLGLPAAASGCSSSPPVALPGQPTDQPRTPLPARHLLTTCATRPLIAPCPLKVEYLGNVDVHYTNITCEPEGEGGEGGGGGRGPGGRFGRSKD